MDWSPPGLTVYDCQDFDVLVGTRKTVECLVKDRNSLITFYDFTAEHWSSIRTTNPTESTFSTLCSQTRRAMGCLSRESALHLIFKPSSVAQSRWKRLRGFTRLADVVAGYHLRTEYGAPEGGRTKVTV